ncbi:MAG TPA: hypothetical protein VLK24_12315 [Gaiellaceae bacterium]|nr:hypothetical protein [Gaiellaceae bacterium]
MSRTLLGPFALALALAPAAAGAGRPPEALGLTAAPARLVFHGSGLATVRLRNPGRKAVAVTVASAGFALDLRGRPRIVKRRVSRSAAGWLRLRPAHLRLAPHAAGKLLVSAKLPRGAEPGDHDALVVLSARPLARARVSVRLRLGVVVVVRAPGAVIRRVELGRLRVVRRGGRRTLELAVVDSGNVTERLLRVRATLLRSSRRLATVGAGARELRPHTRGLLEFRLPRSANGVVTARVVVPAAPGRRVIRRTYRLRI